MRSDISIKQELFEIYQRNFPFIERNEDTVRWILGNADNRVIEERNALGRLIGAAVVNQNALLLLCVDAEYRNRGIGTGLLEGAEQAVRDSGFGTIAVGAGFDYITPGVPTSRSRFDSENEELYPELDRAADDFFTKRGKKSKMYAPVLMTHGRTLQDITGRKHCTMRTVLPEY